MSDLTQRCREVLEWHRTGLLPPDAALRALAKTMPQSEEHSRLRAAEDETARQAMRWVMLAQP